MNLRLIPQISLFALGLTACELGTKNMSDSGTGDTSSGGSASASSGPATATEPNDTGVTGSSTGDPLLCDDPLLFPGVSKSCARNSECGLIAHQLDCCGSLISIGINADTFDYFGATEAACAAMFPACECAPKPMVAEDGKTAMGAARIIVMCVDNMCQSSVTEDPEMQWYTTCGDPVCMGYTKPEGVAPCIESEGLACYTAGATCDPMSDCNALLVCATEDPKQQPGGCPI